MKSMKNTLLLAIVAAGCAAVGTARANTLVYEPFNYTTGAALDGQGNSSDIGFATGSTWAKFSGTAGANTIVSPGLTYTDSAGNSLAVSGNAAKIAGSEVEYRNLGATYGGSKPTSEV